MKNYAEVLATISKFRAKGLFFTNFYLNQKIVENWLDKLCFYEFDDFGCFCRDENGVKYLYFFLKDINDLAKALKKVREKIDGILVYEIILNDNFDYIKKISYESGFSLRLEINRMSFVGQCKTGILEFQNNIEFANFNDISRILEFLKSEFDVISERIPTKNECEEYIKNRQILVCKKDGALVGCIIFSVFGKTMLLNHIIVKREFRSLKIGQELLQKAINLASEANRFILWVRNDNEPAIKLYEKFGYKMENLKNFTFYSEFC